MIDLWFQAQLHVQVQVQAQLRLQTCGLLKIKLVRNPCDCCTPRARIAIRRKRGDPEEQNRCYSGSKMACNKWGVGGGILLFTFVSGGGILFTSGGYQWSKTKHCPLANNKNTTIFHWPIAKQNYFHWPMAFDWPSSPSVGGRRPT